MESVLFLGKYENKSIFMVIINQNTWILLDTYNMDNIPCFGKALRNICYCDIAQICFVDAACSAGPM